MLNVNDWKRGQNCPRWFLTRLHACYATQNQKINVVVLIFLPCCSQGLVTSNLNECIHVTLLFKCYIFLNVLLFFGP